MNENPELLSPDVEKEMEWMNARGKHSYNHRKIDRSVRRLKIVKIALFSFLIITILAILFVLIFRYITNETDTIRQGDYDIKLQTTKENVYLTYNLEDKTNRLLGSGVTTAHKSSTVTETYLLGSTGVSKSYRNVFDAFASLTKAKANQIVMEENAVGSEFKTQYLDDVDKGYVVFFENFYANQFYLANDSSEEVSYTIEVLFKKGSNDSFKSARLILGSLLGEEVEYQAFGYIGSGSSDEYVSHSQKVSSSQGDGMNYLLNPNLEGNDDGKAVLVKVNESVPTDAWKCQSLTATSEEDLYSCETKAFTLKPGEKIMYSMLFYFEASDPDHSKEIANGSTGFSMVISTK